MRPRLAFALLAAVACLVALTAPAAVSAGRSQPVKDGYYGGGSSHGFFIYFDVSSRKIPYARIYSEQLKGCTGLGGPGVFDLEEIDSKGKYKLSNDTTFPGNGFIVKGRFTSPTRAQGTVRWTTTGSCPPGTYTFDYRINRYGP